ncbi:hypothetical protein TrCOL_g8136 [Triparma columacea]|nr:hypothetical protein TrCOL_g8136 [Triparma columacea]
MSLMTVSTFTEIPSSCELCLNSTSVITADCVCEGEPLDYLTKLSNALYIIFTAEYLARILLFSPLPHSAGGSSTNYLVQLVAFILNPWQVIDLLSVLPFWLEFITDMRTFSAIRILRLSRIFQVVKLGKHNRTFVTFGRVMKRSTPALNLLFVILFFGMLVFGSLIYECERGSWKYTDLTSPPSWQYVRTEDDGVTEEITPFTSIPAAYWWFIVTATTVGYGDMSPTSPYGKGISVLAIILSLLVVAFPVSVFTNLWKEEFGGIGPRESTGSLGLGGKDGEEVGGGGVGSERGVNESFGFTGSGVRLNGGGASKSSRVTFGNDAQDAMAMERSEVQRNPAEVGEEIRRLLGVIEEAKEEIQRLTLSM